MQRSVLSRSLVKRSLVKVAAVAAVGVLALAGCGGDDDDDSSGGNSDETISEAEFQSQADAICKSFEAKFEEASSNMSELGEDATPEQVGEAFVDEILPVFRDEIDELQALPTPDKNADAYDDLFNDLESATDDIEQQAKDDPQKLFSSEDDPYADLDQRAQDLGLEQCGSSE